MIRNFCQIFDNAVTGVLQVDFRVSRNSIVLYGGESWKLKANSIRRIEAFRCGHGEG